MARSRQEAVTSTAMDDTSALLESSVRRRIVDTLANLPTTPDAEGHLPGLTAADLAAELDLHVTTVRFHLDQLVAGEVLASEFRAGRVGRPRKLYRFKPGSLSSASPDAAYRALAELLAECWSETDGAVPLTPEEAGRRWARSHTETEGLDQAPARTPGAWIGKVGRTVDLLARWGYTPDVRTSDGGRTAEMTLYDCPFLALAQTQPEVVCGVHQGLLRGTMEAVGETETDVSLRPMVGPRRCEATITTRTAFVEANGRQENR